MADVTDGTSPKDLSKSNPLEVNPEVDYTWSKFFSLLSGNGSREEYRKYVAARDIVKEESDCKRCEDNKEWLFQYSPIIRFMRSNIQKLGHDVNETNVRCRRCTEARTGGFDKDYGILLCANQFQSRSQQEDTMAHEMVHAYDHLRFKMEPNTNLRHAACTEIRASMLSGECRFMREFWSRSQWRVTQQMQECVRRRAILSVAHRRKCKDKEEATRVVNEVWDSCFSDTRPFDEIYR